MTIMALLTTCTKAETYCRDNHDENQVSKGSPTVDECEALILAIDPDVNRYPGRVQEAIYRYGNCIIGGNSSPDAPQPVVTLSGQDLRDIIRRSIDTYSYKFDDGITRVGTKGTTTCGWGEFVTTFDWGLY
ncbi:hypothetical protein QBC43DRAFT_289603 [Cladorrhinum sp. PSN259]|nr:hypothetical protein QBC43DRAFT_289603 [Cladorrhinum sp. PSN259]